jgi:hypothetical protein
MEQPVVMLISVEHIQTRQWAGPSLPQMHKDLVTSERGGPNPYRAVKPWLLYIIIILTNSEENYFL